MKRLLLTFISLMLLILATHGAVARWAGLETEQEIQRLMARMEENPRVLLSQSAYQRGWYSSESRYTLTLLLDTTNVTLRAIDTIHHGPLVAGLGVGLGHIQSKLFFAEQEQPAITGEAHVALNGRTSGDYLVSNLRLNLPVENDGTIQLHADNGSARFLYTPRNGQLETRLTLDTLTLPQAPTGYKAVLNAIRLHQVGRRADAQAAPGLWLGETQLDIGSIVLEDDAGDTMAFRGLALGAYSVPHNASFSGEIALAMEALESDHLNTGAGRLRFTFSRIGFDAWLKLMDLQEQSATAQANDQTPGSLLLLNGLELLQAFSRHGPELAIEELVLDMGDEELLEASASVRYPQDTALNLFNPLIAMNALSAKIDIDAPRALARYWLRRHIMQELPDSRPQTHARRSGREHEDVLEEKIEQALEALPLHPMLELDGDRLRLRMSLDNGQVMINGTPSGSLLNLLVP